ncbi:Disease resistance protein L6 [Linum grandiflorum]
MEYEVFLSFRGPDVRANFVDFLYRDLDRSKIRTFLDDVELRKGEEIAPSLVKAIEESKVYIPILSQNYASSKWCLRELALMMKCRNQGNGHIILPIFYMMAPRDVRHQEGSYKEAFRQHANRYKMETVNEWKDALGEVGNMKGWHVTESDRQGAIIGKVFTEVWSHLMSNYMLVTDELIGIESHVEKVTRLLSSDSEGVRIVGIHGMGGIGKTTIAKAVYNGIFGQFDRFWFLEDAREVLSKSNGVVTLQSMLISSILRTDYKVKDASEGLRVIKDRVCQHKVLVVLDNVNDSFEFDKILGKWDEFSSGSRFIVTTRDKRILQVLQECKFYEPGEMNHEHALVLFCKHAFGTDKPPEGEGFLSMEFVKAAAGLPLALKVIGSLLFRRERRFREAKLIEFKDIPPEKLQERLKVSYNDLTRTERQIFLDIASSFIGEKRDLPSYMWNDCRLYPESGISTLMLRSLVRFNERNEFLMHDHIRDLGIAVIREENNQHPWKRSRIWSNEDALEMLKDEEGSDQVEVLRVNMEEETLELTDEQFKKLTGLRYLEVFSGRLTGDFKGVLPNLRWLKLHNCSSIPSDLNMKKLVILDMHDCPVNDDWNAWTGIQAAQKLKAVSLSFCGALRKAPDLSQCRTLESIHFWNCREMGGELHIGNFKSLKLLSLTMTKITKLTGKIRMLKNLEEIDAKILTLTLKEVAILPTSLKKLSLSSSQVPNLSELTDLEELSFDRCDQLQLPADIWKLSKLKTLKIWDSSCSNSLLADESSTDSSLPSSLNSLLICGCQHLIPCDKVQERLMISFLDLTHEEQEIFLDIASIFIGKQKEHPIYMWSACDFYPEIGVDALILKSLIKINDKNEFWMHDSIRDLGRAIVREKDPWRGSRIWDSEDVQDILMNEKVARNLKSIRLYNCYSLQRAPDLSQCENLELIDIDFCTEMSGELHIGNLENLKVLKISFTKITDLTGDIGLLQNLQEINHIPKMWKSKTVPTILPTSLKRLALSSPCIPNLMDIECLEKLVLHDYQHQFPGDMWRLSKLKILKLSSFRCESLFGEKMDGPCSLPSSLISIEITDSMELESLPNLANLNNLTLLVLRETSVREIHGLEKLMKLETLEISEAPNLINLGGLEHLKLLKRLVLVRCYVLEKLPDLSNLAKLQRLEVSDHTQEIAEIMGLEYLEINLLELDISGSTQLTEIVGLEGLELLKKLSMRG